MFKKMQSMMLKAIALTAIFTSTLWNAALADTIGQIVVEGNQRVETATVETYLPFRRGDDFTADKVGDVIKTLYATGLFHQVDVKLEQGVVTVTVQENPLVNKVVIEGNEEVAAERLKENLILKERALFTPAKAQRDAALLEEMYQSRGMFLTKVTPQIIGRDQNRVDVIYKIEEGAETKIAGVEFIGNRRFSDSELGDVITTKPDAWWKIFGGSSYDPNRLDVDKDLLRRYYLQHGYADFQVQSAVAELSRDRSKFYITFTMTEGPKYDFGKIDVALDTETVENISANDVLAQVPLKTGELYNASRVDKTIDTLIDYLGDNGYAFLEVEPSLKRNEAVRTLDITFDVKPGPRVYVERIDIKGNSRTQDHVIRREMRLAEGDAYSANKLRRSRDRVNRLGYFKTVDLTREEGSAPDRINVEVDVEEQSTGEFNVGAGFSTFEGLLASADVRERNFLGKGQDLALRFTLSETRQLYNLSFTEPYFMEQELAAGIDLFNEETDVQDESSFDRSDTGGALRFRFPINEFTGNTVRVGYKETKISNVGSSASSLVAREVGKRSSATLSNSYAIDTRDSYLNPTRGYRLSLTADYSGLGTDVNYLRGVVNGSWHNELLEDVILSVGARAGAMSDLGDDLPIYEHFTAGGTSLRGFDASGIGPRDSQTKDALGGMYLVGNNVELSFPLFGFLDDIGMRGVLFSDGGIVTDFDDATSVVTDSKIYRVSAGGGVHWQSPVGPLRLEFGVPLIKAEEDQTQVFSFSIGSRF